MSERRYSGSCQQITVKVVIRVVVKERMKKMAKNFEGKWKNGSL